MKLQDKEKLFVEAYIGKGKFSASNAYRIAFDTDETGILLSNRAYKMKNKPAVKEEIEKRLSEKVGSHKEIANRMLEKLKEMSFADKDDEFYDPNIQLKAIKTLQDQLGLNIKKINQTVDGGLSLEITWDDNDDKKED